MSQFVPRLAASRKLVHGCLSALVTRSQSPRHYCTPTGKHVPPPSVGVVRHNWSSKFKEAGIFEPNESAEFIIAHALGEKSLVNVNHARLLTKEQIEIIKRLCKERLSGKPVQYVIGEWDFHGIKIMLKPPVLIPRPETEQLVELAITDVEKSDTSPFNCLEIGCGSGAISLALMKAFPQVHVTAIDVSEVACDLTRQNAELNEVCSQMEIHRLELGESSLKHQLFSEPKYQLIISNPPYVCSQEIQNLPTEIKDYEDRQALDGGPDGLDVIKFIIKAAESALCSEGSLWLEVNDHHPEVMPEIVKDSSLQIVGTHLDFSKKPRFCHLRKRSE